MDMPKPKSIILGALVGPADEAWMRDFCRTNRIALERVVRRPNEFRLEIRDFTVLMFRALPPRGHP